MITSITPVFDPMNKNNQSIIEDGQEDIESTTRKMTIAKSEKNIPVELTAYGTTPSGKPRLFVCTTCTRAFARLEHLRRHERSHTKEKPFGCGVCQRKFSRRDLLLRHAQKLHAGCAEAITRLRRKSVKRLTPNQELSKTPMSTDDQLLQDTPMMPSDMGTQDSIMEDHAETCTTDTISTKDDQKKNSSKNPYDLVQFNLNLFNQSMNVNGRKGSLRESGSLQKQIFDKKKSQRNRGASFSAQSGANYAVGGLSEFNDTYPGTDTVEFSTPQLEPTVNDDHSWLTLSTIPNMIEDDFANYMNGFSGNRLARQSSISNNNSGDVGGKHSSSISDTASNKLRSDSLASTASYSIVDPFSGGYVMPTTTISNAEFSVFKNKASSNGGTHNHDSKLKGQELFSTGYSFYDIPESSKSGMNDSSNFGYFPTPGDKDDHDTSMPFKHYEATKGQTTEEAPNAQTFLDDFATLENQMGVNSKNYFDGYSFYGDYISASSSAMDGNSPNVYSPDNQKHENMINSSNNAIIDSFSRSQMHLLGFTHNGESPENGRTPNNPFLNQAQLMNIENNPPDDTTQKNGTYSRNKLFTNNIRHHITASLAKYPVSDMLTPTIPSNEKLEYYTNLFNKLFLKHFSFIHASKLNEYEIMNMTSGEPSTNDSARSCLPLLVATMGALLANNKTDSENLYEASRRTIHIYLDCRKAASAKENQSLNHSMNPLWLIQSLTLSVIYGLFSENENNVYIVVRQLNALNSLVKTSIKTSSDIFFSIHGDDEQILKRFRALQKQHHPASDTLFVNSSVMNDEEVRFKYSIIAQSQVRIIFMIYRLTNFLLMLYNVPLTLSLNDLGSLKAPTKKDEFLWCFKNYQDVTDYMKLKKISLDFKVEDFKPCFKDILYQVSSLTSQTCSADNMDRNLSSGLHSLGQFGYICLIHGVFELNQYQGMSSIDVVFLMDTISLYYKRTETENSQFITGRDHEPDGISSSLHSQVSSSAEVQLLDYSQLVNFVKLSSLIDFKYVKESSWLKNYDELTQKYCVLLMNNKTSDKQFIEIADYCIFTIKLILFRVKVKYLTDQNRDKQFNSYIDNDLHLMEHIDSASNYFENLMDIEIFEDFTVSKDSIHSQMLFHVFTLLSVFSIHVIKRNHQVRDPMNQGIDDQNDNRMLNQRFRDLLRVLGKIENVLKVRYQNMKLENEYTGLYLYSNSLGFNDDMKIEDFGLEKVLYVLKIGELVMGFIYETNIKVSIFKKLAASLSQFRKFLIDNENMFLT